MSLCSICPEPGRCCKQFCLPSAPPFWKSSWEEDAQAWLDKYELPYAPHSIGSTHTDEESGEEYVAVWFGCPHVTEKGLCGIYQTRPDTCRTFLPGSDSLCVFHKDARYAYSSPPESTPEEEEEED
jgi:Fe-S-cluster containining protein